MQSKETRADTSWNDDCILTDYSTEADIIPDISGICLNIILIFLINAILCIFQKNYLLK